MSGFLTDYFVDFTGSEITSAESKLNKPEIISNFTVSGRMYFLLRDSWVSPDWIASVSV